MDRLLRFLAALGSAGATANARAVLDRTTWAHRRVDALATRLEARSTTVSKTG